MLLSIRFGVQSLRSWSTHMHLQVNKTTTFAAPIVVEKFVKACNATLSLIDNKAFPTIIKRVKTLFIEWNVKYRN